jgi:hypothetical protein
VLPPRITYYLNANQEARFAVARKGVVCNGAGGGGYRCIWQRRWVFVLLGKLSLVASLIHFNGHDQSGPVTGNSTC